MTHARFYRIQRLEFRRLAIEGSVMNMLKSVLRSALLMLAINALMVPTMAMAEGDVHPTKLNNGNQSESVQFERIGMSGPRFGVTFVPGNTELAKTLREKGMNPVISQFGWHFERRIAPRAGGPEFVIETIPLVGAVEYGKFVPSVTLAMGIRFPSGWEFGVGPNLVLRDKEGESPLSPSLMVAIGYSFRYSGVSLPVNIAFASNPDGNRISLMFGYAIQR